MTYYALAGHYTIGDPYTYRSDAFAEAGRRLSRFLHENDTTDRLNPLTVTVDERVSDETGDRIVRRYVVTAVVSSCLPARPAS